jgi:hypothetical protein
MEHSNLENQILQESKERGRNVKIIVKFLRHGERTLDGKLTDYGREVTKVRAIESGIKLDDYHAVKAVGSEAGVSSGAGARALETADIYAHEIAGDDAFRVRTNSILNYETLLNPVPYNHVEVYNSFLPENFETFSDEEKSAVAKVAQTKTVGYLTQMETPQAIAYREEIAGSFASIILHYCDMLRRLYSGSSVLIPAGTHGGTMEMLLREALVRKDRDGQEVPQDFGGEFNPSEAYNVDIETDENGELKKLRVTFDDPKREVPEDVYLALDKVKKFAKYYEELHKDKTNI